MDYLRTKYGLITDFLRTFAYIFSDIIYNRAKATTKRRS